MSGLSRVDSLFEQIPALGSISAAGAGMAKLIPVDFDHPGFELREGLNRIGRDPETNDFVIASEHVSRRHCDILVGDGSFVVQDLDSANGVYVNGKRVTEIEIEVGDRLALSRKLVFRFVMDPRLEQPEVLELDAEPAVPGERQSYTGTRRAIRATAEVIEAVKGPEKPIAATESSPGVVAHASRASFADLGDLADLALDDVAVQRALLRQRNVIAMLYQVSLRCLMAGNVKETEELLTNVLRRLAPMDTGFMVYKRGGKLRAAMVPTADMASRGTIRSIVRLGLSLKRPTVYRRASELEAIGVPAGSALLVPLSSEEAVSGLLCCLSRDEDRFSPETVEVISHLGNVASAALFYCECRV